MVEAVVFDLFETLVTESGVRPVRASSLGEALGLEPEAFRAEWKARRPRVVLGRLAFTDALTEISRTLNGGVDGAAIREVREQRVREKARVFAEVDRHVADMIRALRAEGVRLAVVSNCFAEDVQAWSAWALAQAFQCVVFSWEAGLAKPDARVYTTVTRRLAVQAGASVFISEGGTASWPVPSGRSTRVSCRLVRTTTASTWVGGRRGNRLEDLSRCGHTCNSGLTSVCRRRPRVLDGPSSLLARNRVLTKERPHLPRGVDAAARGAGKPFRHRLATRPRMAASLDRVEQHVRLVHTARKTSDE